MKELNIFATALTSLRFKSCAGIPQSLLSRLPLRNSDNSVEDDRETIEAIV